MAKSRVESARSLSNASKCFTADSVSSFDPLYRESMLLLLLLLLLSGVLSQSGLSSSTRGSVVEFSKAILGSFSSRAVPCLATVGPIISSACLMTSCSCLSSVRFVNLVIRSGVSFFNTTLANLASFLAFFLRGLVGR